MNTTLHATSIVKHVETIVATLILKYCNICWIFFKKNSERTYCSIAVLQHWYWPRLMGSCYQKCRRCGGECWEIKTVRMGSFCTFCMMVKLAMQNDSFRLSALGGIIWEIKTVAASSFISVTFNHCYRSCNRIAHALAAIGCIALRMPTLIGR